MHFFSLINLKFSAPKFPKNRELLDSFINMDRATILESSKDYTEITQKILIKNFQNLRIRNWKLLSSRRRVGIEEFPLFFFVTVHFRYSSSLKRKDVIIHLEVPFHCSFCISIEKE